MKAAITFEAEERNKTGRGEARALRRSGRVPAILYSKELKPVSFSVEAREITKHYLKGAFQSKLVEIQVGGKNYHALARDLQLHPVSDKIEHVDFLQVNEDSKIAVNVPLRIRGAEKSQGLKRGGALNMVRHTVELLCSPANIPTRIEIDISSAQIGDSIHISEITLPEGVTPTITDRDFTLVTIAGRLKEEKVETDEAEGDEASAEGEEKAEGEE